MQRSRAKEELRRAVEQVLEDTDARERIDEQKKVAKERRERADTLWFELILSMATLGKSQGSVLATDDDYYSKVRYHQLPDMEEAERTDRLEEVLLDAGVRFPNKKARYISTHVDRIEEMGGLESAQEEFEYMDGEEKKMQFLKGFKGIGDKYSRNIGMDLYHPDFRNTVAVDTRIGNVTAELEIDFNSYEREEEFYVSVAEQLSMTPWELDRTLYRYTDEVINEIP